MANIYYNRLNDFLPGTRIRSLPVDAELNSVVAGFGLATKELKRKTANQDVMGKTMVDDDHLTGFSMVAGGIYRVLGGFHVVEVTPTADVNCQLVVSTSISDESSIAMFGGQTTGSSIARGQYVRAAAGATVIGPARVISFDMTRDPAFKLKAIVVASSFQASTLKLQWSAVDLADTDVCVLRMKANSWMQLEKIN